MVGTERILFSIRTSLLLLAVGVHFALPFEVQAAAQVVGARGQCEGLFSVQPELTLDRSDYVRANGVFVTGASYYPLEYVLRNLDLKSENLTTTLRPKSTLSVAEGTSGLLPYFLTLGLNIKALDIWYHSEKFPDNRVGREMRDFSEQYAPYLIRGDATQIPMPTNSYDLVLSHLLVNNIMTAKPLVAMVNEMVRVVSVGGEARIFGFVVEDLPLATGALKKQFGDSISIEVVEHQVPAGVSLETFDPWFKNRYRLLKVKKIK